MMEDERVQHDHRNEQKRDQCHRTVDAGHKNKGHHDEDHYAQKLGQLFRDKGPDRLHVRGAALDDVSGLILIVPCERETQDVREQLVSHRLEQRLRASGVHQLRQIPENSRRQRKSGHGQRDRAEMMSEKGNRHRKRDEGRQCRLPVSDDRIHGKTDHLRVDQIE